MMVDKASFEDRKALLLAKSELARLKMVISCRALRHTLAPQVNRYRDERMGLLGIGLRLSLVALGASRAKRLRRGATLALVLWRLWRHWNRLK